MFKIIEAYQQSGQTQRAFCKEREIAFTTFLCWLKKYRREIFFEYQTGRNAKFHKETLSNFKGYFQTDDYGGYNEVGRRSDVMQLACFAHARLKF